MRKSLSLLVALLISGCNSNLVYHGYAFKDLPNLKEKIHKLEEKKASTQEVVALLGSPTFTETFKQGDQMKRDLFYLEEIFIQKPLIGKKLQKIQVLRLTFNYKDQLDKSNLLEIEQPYYYDSHKMAAFDPYQLKFFEQINRNFNS